MENKSEVFLPTEPDATFLLQLRTMVFGPFFPEQEF